MADFPKPPPLHKMVNSNQMRLALNKETVGIIKNPSNSSSPAPVHQSVIRGPPPKVDKDSSPVDKPIIIPTVPKLLSAITSNKQPTVAQLFSYSTNTQASTAKLFSNANDLSKSTVHAIGSSLGPFRYSHSPKKIAPKPSKMTEQSTSQTEVIVKTKTPKRSLSEDERGSSGAPKPKKPKKDKSKSGPVSGLPLSKVRTIMKMNSQFSHDTTNTSQEAVALVSKATEMLISLLAKRSLGPAKDHNSKTISYSHLASSVQRSNDLHFLHAAVPKKVVARDILGVKKPQPQSADKQNSDPL